MLLQDLFEEAPKFTELSTEDAIHLMNEKCKDALWMLAENKPFWRGQSEEVDTFAVANPLLTTRKSAHTRNYYTAILDNIQAMKDYPKRSKSFVASTDRNYARNYGDGIAIAIIPFDDVKIGFTNNVDIWDTSVNFLGTNTQFPDINELLYLAGCGDTWQDILNFCADVKDTRTSQFIDLANAAETINLTKYTRDFKTHLETVFAPKSTKFTYATTATMDHKSKGEVWIGGPCMFINAKLWNEMVSEFNKK